MAAADYHTAVMQHVSDTSTYEEVTDRVTDVVIRATSSLKRLLKEYGFILGDSLRGYMMQGLGKCTPSDMYILPKLHKMKSLDGPVVGRPIVACHSWVTTYVSVWLADQLNAVLPNYPTILADRTHLIRDLESMRVHRDAWLVTFDVESLYPHVEHTGCITACAAAVPGTSQHKAMIADMLRFVLENNVVHVKGRFYRQLFGGAMGTNCMPPAAQLYLAIHWEAVVKQTIGSLFPEFYRRFIDDGFCIFEGTTQDLMSGRIL